MKKSIIALVVGVALVAGHTMLDVALARNDCQKPSANEKFCISTPSNQVSDCTAYPGSGGDCVGHSTYVRNKFPDGATSADSGTTTEEEADCYQETRCKQYENDATKCVAASPLPWLSGDKTVVGTNQCPTE